MLTIPCWEAGERGEPWGVCPGEREEEGEESGRFSIGRRSEHCVLISFARVVWSGEGMGDPVQFDLGLVDIPEHPVLSMDDPDSTEEVLAILRDRAISILRGAKDPLHFLGESVLSSLGKALFLSDPDEHGRSESLSPRAEDMSNIPDSVANPWSGDSVHVRSKDLDTVSGEPREALVTVSGEPREALVTVSGEPREA